MIKGGLIQSAFDAIARLKDRYRQGPAHIKTGKLGEDLAVNALRADGYKIVERNARVYKREIDIIAVDGSLLVFVEVKARADHSLGKPIEAVNRKRQARIRKAADLYMIGKKLRNSSVRFDVVTVDFTDDPKGNVEIVKNAF